MALYGDFLGLAVFESSQSSRVQKKRSIFAGVRVTAMKWQEIHDMRPPRGALLRAQRTGAYRAGFTCTYALFALSESQCFNMVRPLRLTFPQAKSTLLPHRRYSLLLTVTNRVFVRNFHIPSKEQTERPGSRRRDGISTGDNCRRSRT